MNTEREALELGKKVRAEQEKVIALVSAYIESIEDLKTLQKMKKGVIRKCKK